MIKKIRLSKEEVNEAIFDYLQKKGVVGEVKIGYLFSYQKPPLSEPLIQLAGVEVIQKTK